MIDTVAHIRVNRPKFTILENVQGMSDKFADEQFSALDVILQDLGGMNYAARVFDMSVAPWVDMERSRTRLLHQQMLVSLIVVQFVPSVEARSCGEYSMAQSSMHAARSGKHIATA